MRQAVPPDDYITHILSAKFCPVCGGFSQWTPRLAEALHYECVPIILSPMMLPPWSGVLDWSKFTVRMEPTRDNLLRLKEHLKTLDHGAMLRNVRAAKHALTYRLDAYQGDDMLPLLLYEMSKVPSCPRRSHEPPTVPRWGACPRLPPARPCAFHSLAVSPVPVHGARARASPRSRRCRSRRIRGSR